MSLVARDDLIQEDRHRLAEDRP